MTTLLRPKYPSPVQRHIVEVRRVAGLGALGMAAAAGDAEKGASVGATVGSVIPGIGTAIGAAVGAVAGAIGSLFGPAKEGQAELTWDDMVNNGYLSSKTGRQFDERYWAEAAKGMMDKGTNVFPNCGASGHTNPDCFFSKLAETIVQGYLSQTVPLTASTDQVYSSVVLPWLQSGAGGLVNYSVLNPEWIQQLMIKAGVDRYISGLPITRANMASYASDNTYQQWSEPDILTALAPLVAQLQAAAAAPPVAAAPPPASVPVVPPPVVNTMMPSIEDEAPPEDIINPAPMPASVPVSTGFAFSTTDMMIAAAALLGGIYLVTKKK